MRKKCHGHPVFVHKIRQVLSAAEDRAQDRKAEIKRFAAARFEKEDCRGHPDRPGQPGEEHVCKRETLDRRGIACRAGRPDQALEQLLDAEQEGQGADSEITAICPECDIAAREPGWQEHGSGCKAGFG